MTDDERTRREQTAYAAAWQDLRVRHCLREAAMVMHLRKPSGLRDEFLAVAAQTFDVVAVELQAMAKARPEWPREDEFAVAASDETPPGTAP